MGITLTAKNAKHSFDMGAGGFFNLRANIADALDDQFGKHYRKLSKCYYQTDYEEHDRISNKILSDPKFNKYTDVANFLYESDCEGKAGYKTCKKIYDLIKDIDFKNKYFRYGNIAHNDYEEFKSFLKDCYSHRRNMYWY